MGRRRRGGLSFRKSINLGGGVRLNLSSKGIGTSFGVKGFRVSTGPRGTYLNAGRGGWRYTRQLGPSPRSVKARSARLAAPRQPTSGQPFTYPEQKPVNVPLMVGGIAALIGFMSGMSWGFFASLVLGVLFGTGALLLALKFLPRSTGPTTPVEPVPAVQPMSRYIPVEVRRQVWARDGGRCVECGSDQYLEFDHIIPHSKGGANTVGNVQLLCRTCNLAKGDRI